MKSSRALLWIVLSFIAGCSADKVYTGYQFEKNRAELEAHYQTVFLCGDDFEKISGPQKESLVWRYDEQSHRFDAIIPPNVARRLHLQVEVDEHKKIQKVSVVTHIRI